MESRQLLQCIASRRPAFHLGSNGGRRQQRVPSSFLQRRIHAGVDQRHQLSCIAVAAGHQRSIQPRRARRNQCGGEVLRRGGIGDGISSVASKAFNHAERDITDVEVKFYKGEDRGRNFKRRQRSVQPRRAQHDRYGCDVLWG
eukprot:365447-Chlamydomonas_euryale.AAC.6